MKAPIAGYVLHVDDDEWDVRRFERSVAEARAARTAGRLDEAVALFAAADAQWSGEPFADVPPGATVEAAATALTELRLAALGEWFEARLAIGPDPKLVADLTHYVAANPFHEQLVAQLMLALHRSGRRADALRAFRHAREQLAGELGIEPGAQLQRVHRLVLASSRVLASDVALDAASTPGRWARQLQHRAASRW